MTSFAECCEDLRASEAWNVGDKTCLGIVDGAGDDLGNSCSHVRLLLRDFCHLRSDKSS